MRALVISDVRFYREGIADALRQDGFVAAAIDATPAAIERARRREGSTDVALIDLVEKTFRGSLQALGGDVPVVGLALTRTPGIAAAAALGVRAFVGCEQTLAELLQATRRAAAGEAVCPASIAAVLFATLGGTDQSGPAQPVDTLTVRERQIAKLLIDGLSNKEIAAELVIEPTTVKNHVHQILGKLGARRRGQAAAMLADRWIERSPRPDRMTQTGARRG